MYYVLKTYSGDEEKIEGEDSIFEVNKKLKEKDYRSLTMCLDNDTFFIDFMLKNIVAKGKDIELNLPKTSEKANCINRRRVTWMFGPGESKLSKIVWLFGFSVIINSKEFIRYLEIDKGEIKLVED